MVLIEAAIGSRRTNSIGPLLIGFPLFLLFVARSDVFLS